jgi:hypothetical protein
MEKNSGARGKGMNELMERGKLAKAFIYWRRQISHQRFRENPLNKIWDGPTGIARKIITGGSFRPMHGLFSSSW